MLYKVKWMEKKNNDWIVAQLVEGASMGSPAEFKDVSINRVNKKGETFPNFDDIQSGRDVEGEIWTSDSGKNYLFAPKTRKNASGGAFKQKMIEDTMNKKEASIERFQGNKEEAIKLASAQRDAVLVVVQLMSNRNFNEEEIRDRITDWRNWFLSDDFKAPPF